MACAVTGQHVPKLLFFVVTKQNYHYSNNSININININNRSMSAHAHCSINAMVDDVTIVVINMIYGCLSLGNIRQGDARAHRLCTVMTA